MVGGKKTCDTCGESYQGGTDLSKYGCRCKRRAFCDNLKCYQIVDADGSCSACNPQTQSAQTPRPGLMRQLSSRSNELMKAFKKFDKNGSGGLDPEEFKEVVSKCLEMPTDNELVAEFFKLAVQPGQNEVSFQAFCEFLDIKEEK